MKQLIYFLLFVLIGAGCTDRSPFISGLTPEGYEQAGPLTVYNRNTIFDYINGEAEVYFPFGFTLLYSQGYRSREGGARLTVDAYEMKTPAGARGVFDKFAMEEDSLIDGVGGAAYYDGFLLLMKSGRYFVRVMPNTSGGQSEKVLREDLIDIGRKLHGVLGKGR